MTTLTTSSKSRPHALAVPSPAQGHIHPLMELSKRLVSAGFMVSFANTEANHKKIKAFSEQSKSREKKDERAGGEEQGEEEGEEGKEGLHLVSLEEGFPLEYENGLNIIADVFKPEFKAAVACLLERLCEKGPPVSLLVFDFRLAFLVDIARDAGIPSLSFWTQSAAHFACNLLATDQGFQLPPDDSILITSIQGVPPFKCSEIPNKAIDLIPPPFPSNRYAWEPFKRVCEPTWIAFNTFKELEIATMDTLHGSLAFQPFGLGPLVSTPSFSITKGTKDINFKLSHLEWLERHPQRSVLYIAFGTVVKLSEEQLEELVLGLEASQQAILWVFRSDLCQNSKNHNIDTLSLRFKNQGLIVNWAPQWDILLHPAIGGFLTHCGWNSTLEGITAGIPMLAWPGFVDQYLTRRCLEEKWGIGIGFKHDETIGNLISRFEIQHKVREVMQGKIGMEMRKKASNLSNASKRAYEEGGSSYKDFALLIKAIESFDLKGKI